MWQSLCQNLIVAGIVAVSVCCYPGTSGAQPTYLPPLPRAKLGKPLTEPPAIGLPDLLSLALQNNPKLAQAGFDVGIAQGKAWQAGLYPNPILMGTWDEVGDVQGKSGIVTVPQINQEFVTAGKKKLDRAVALRQMTISEFKLARQRIGLITDVRKKYYSVLAWERRITVLKQLTKLAGDAVEVAEKKLKAKQISELDVLPLRVELNRNIAKLEAAYKDHVTAWRQLAAAIGLPQLPLSMLAGSLDQTPPEPNFELARQLMLERHPEVFAAEAEIARAELALKRASVEKIPNVNIGAGYVRQNQNKSDDWMIQFSFPIPVFDRNQGNVQAAKADLARAFQEVRRVEVELSQELATAFGQFSAALKQIERYRTGILKDADRSFELFVKGYEAGQVEYLRVIQAQQAVFAANLEYVELLAQAWQAGSEMAGLLLIEDWPACALPVVAVPQK